MRFPFTGVIPVDKPAGVSSRAVVDAVAKALRMKAVGHAGTLDPRAEGVVVVCVGDATRLVDVVHALPKHYTAGFLLGRSSASDDLETPVVLEADPVRPAAETLEDAARSLRGEILQRPCDYSAAHVGGQRAYRLARRGRPVELAAKRVRIDRLVITRYEWPRLALDIVCSSGTFVRALGRDLAAAVETRAVMETLVRDAVGPFSRSMAIPLAAVSAAATAAALVPPAVVVEHLQRVTLADDVAARIVRGGLLTADGVPPGDGPFAAFDTAGELLGLLARLTTGAYRLRPNFRGSG